MNKIDSDFVATSKPSSRGSKRKAGNSNHGRDPSAFYGYPTLDSIPGLFDDNCCTSSMPPDGKGAPGKEGWTTQHYN